jgi:hypothetical protein
VRKPHFSLHLVEHRNKDLSFSLEGRIPPYDGILPKKKKKKKKTQTPKPKNPNFETRILTLNPHINFEPAY